MAPHRSRKGSPRISTIEDLCQTPLVHPHPTGLAVDLLITGRLARSPLARLWQRLSRPLNVTVLHYSLYAASPPVLAQGRTERRGARDSLVTTPSHERVSVAEGCDQSRDQADHGSDLEPGVHR